MKRPVVLALATALTIVGLAGCGSSADDGKVKVVASFYPLAWVSEKVGGTYVNVTNLTSPGVEPHDLELKPKQVAAVQEADLVVFEKHFQAAVDDAVDQADRSKEGTVDVASFVSLERLQDGAEEEGHDHEHGDEDPHTWLDPGTMIALTAQVETHLGAIDPDHASAYTANADRLRKELSDLDAAFETGLARCERDTIVTSHAAFQYLAARYGLKQVPIAGIDPTNEPSPAQLASITRLVRSQGITTIFTEELVSPAIADTIAKETGATTATLDPIEGLSDDTSDQTYLTLMRRNLDAIRKANDCP